MPDQKQKRLFENVQNNFERVEKVVIHQETHPFREYERTESKTATSTGCFTPGQNDYLQEEARRRSKKKGELINEAVAFYIEHADHLIEYLNAMEFYEAFSPYRKKLIANKDKLEKILDILEQ